ncbi:hypothetical protein BDP27DRAFT_1425713 [Rhodocollybia butyracea]|uniref:Uncharacterized protein n=1 Tax=Rhodocollybia butyracea TaxID=206335 RepID=A0A9P5U4D2_9AGAR|nr:hypothetical protein BDP27DRAFT_1425713 [Rhodocollybia butyracea]
MPTSLPSTSPIIDHPWLDSPIVPGSPSTSLFLSLPMNVAIFRFIQGFSYPTREINDNTLYVLQFPFSVHFHRLWHLRLGRSLTSPTQIHRDGSTFSLSFPTTSLAQNSTALTLPPIGHAPFKFLSPAPASIAQWHDTALTGTAQHPQRP